GLHLGLVAGTLFFAARIGIALCPPLALRLNGKKAAALVALFGALGYLLITGQTVPTQRAFVMTALALLAVMVDRNPFSMRLVAIAALLVLLLRPEALLGPSFQMSFGAVVALIAAYESGSGPSRSGLDGLDRRLLLYVAGVFLTTLVASVATAPFAVHHFGRLPTYGILANLVGVPLTAFWIMPSGLLGLLVMPLGLDGPVFAFMGQGIAWLLGLAGWVADLPGAAVRLPPPPLAAVVIMTLGGLWLCLWQQPWRRYGLLGLPLGLVIWLQAPHPDVLIDARGRLIAVKTDDGVTLAPHERDKWVHGMWLERFGEDEPRPWPAPGEASVDGALRCDGLGCVLTRHGQRIAFAERPEALLDDCRLADLVLSYPRVERCPDGTARLIGPSALRASGGMALRIEPREIVIRTVTEDRGARPWTR
ncbi:MAG: ComEC/Rec2 family competence protein, partial [Geminicoccaceae bacterium]|nr:ComEC/Rec2 family competence protein [Geminicoccaceae bacterium]